MVVPLLFLACTQTCTNTCMVTSQRMRKSARTLFVVKQRKETVTDLKKSCTTTQSIQPLHSQSEETSGTFPLMERTLPSALTDTILCLTTISATLLALSSVNEAILARAKNSNGTTVRTFSNFNLLRDHCTLLPFPSALTSFMLSWQY